MKKKLMRFAILTVMIVMNYNLSSQSKPDWTTYSKTDDILIEYKYAECDPRMGYDSELVLLRFKNLSNEKKIVAWDLEAWYGESCQTCKWPDEYHMEIQLRPGEVMEGNCTIECDYRLKIFSKFIDPQYKQEQTPLKKFELANLKVNCLECKTK